jgi:PTS system nitrogen regulatory IIA component
MKRVSLVGIGRLSGATFGPTAGRPRFSLTGRFCHRPADEAKPALGRIGELLLSEDILLDVDVSSKSRLIDEIGCHMQRVHALSRESVVLSLTHREQIGSTGLGQGVAIPHARVKDLDRIRVAYLRLKSPIAFDSPDGNPVSHILVLLVPKQAAEEHLTILAEAAQMLSDRRFREQLHLCRHAPGVKQLFETWPGNGPGH